MYLYLGMTTVQMTRKYQHVMCLLTKEIDSYDTRITSWKEAGKVLLSLDPDVSTYVIPKSNEWCVLCDDGMFCST